MDRRVHHPAHDLAAILHAGNIGVRGSLRPGDVTARARIGVGSGETFARRRRLNFQALAIAIGPMIVTWREYSGSTEAAEVGSRSGTGAVIREVRRTTAGRLLC